MSDQDLTETADRFVDLACLTYDGNESRERRLEASTLLAATPRLVDANVHAAAAAGAVEAVRGHLDRDPDCLSRLGTPRGWVPLLSLCYSRVSSGDARACLDLMIARGADANAHVMLGECQFTALTGVMGEGEAGPLEQPPHPDARALATRLLEGGASPNEAQGIYNTHFLPSNAWLELLLAHGLSSKSDLDFSLGQAAVQGFTDRVRLLLARGVNVDGRSHYNKRTHLENALLEGHAEIAQLLRAAGAQEPVFDDKQRFRVAVLANDRAEAERIVAASPSVIASDALVVAARHGHREALALGLALGLPIDRVDRQGLTPLHEAARNGHLEVVRALVGHGASLVIKDPAYGGTPLGHARHFAARWPGAQRAEVVAFLEQQE